MHAANSNIENLEKLFFPGLSESHISTSTPQSELEPVSTTEYANSSITKEPLDWVQCLFIEFLSFKEKCYENPLRVCTEFRVDNAGSNIEKLKELLSQESSDPQFSKMTVMDNVYSRVVMTAYKHYPIALNVASLDAPHLNKDNPSMRAR